MEEAKIARRTLAAVIAYLQLLDTQWDRMPETDRRRAVSLALEAARRGRGPERPLPRASPT
jgi:hypothetical protein